MLDIKIQFLPDFLGSHKDLNNIAKEGGMTHLHLKSVNKCFCFQQVEMLSLFMQRFINLGKPCLSYSPDTVLLKHLERAVSPNGT